MRYVTSGLKRKRAIKRALEAGTPRDQIKKKYNRGDQLIASVNNTAIKSVKSEDIKKSFKSTLFSLPPDGSRDKEEGSKRFDALITSALTFEQHPEKY